MKKFQIFFLMAASLFMMVAQTSCNKDDDDDDDNTTEVKSRFTPVQDSEDPFTFTFNNESLNADSYAWDFGDGETSTETSPTHTYAAAGVYTVAMTATGSAGSHTSSEEVNVTDPSVASESLAGTTSKTWKLLRDVNGGQYPIQVGPNTFTEIWWALGANDPLDARPCLMEEEYIFHADGTYEYDSKGMVYAEEGIWPEEYDSECVDETNATIMTSIDGADLTPWGSGTFTYNYDAGAQTLALVGLGAHVGLPKVGTDNEYSAPQPAVTYKVVKLVDADVDTLIVQTDLTSAGGYWQFTLVHYDNPADEPEIMGSVPTVGFSFMVSGTEVSFTNNSNNATSYFWDFGDGNTSSEENPVHVYAAEGTYEVTLNATNENGSNTITQTVIVSSATLTYSTLTGDGSKIWRLNPAAGALAVGPGPGSGEWFATTDEDVTSGRPCIFDDDYIFSNTGDYIYDAKGDLFGEPYMGIDPPGCVAEGALPADAAPWGSGNHTFTFTEASGDTPATLTVTGTGAFIGLSKAFNGGEYQSPPPTPNGSVTYEVLSYVNDGASEVMVLTVDISEGEIGGAYWSFTLQAQ